MKTRNQLASHNSMTYLKPHRWWMRLLTPFAKCQSENIITQLMMVDVIDIRIDFYKGMPIYAHGPVKYYPKEGETITDICDHIVKYYPNKKTIRIILENDGKDNIYNFVTLCYNLASKYGEYIRFTGGNLKKDWRQLFEFKNPIQETDIYQFVSSMRDDAKWYEKIWPWAYAERMNVTNYGEYMLSSSINKVYMYDFVDHWLFTKSVVNNNGIIEIY